jgi:hypothetical protein
LLEVPEFQSADMLFGEAMHFAIAAYHRSKNNLTPDEMLAECRRYWSAVTEDAQSRGLEVRYRGAEEAELMEKAKGLCAEYVAQFQSIKADDAELLFQVPLLDPTTGAGSLDHALTGRIDLVANRSLYEFKTTSRSYSQNEADTSIQLTAYALAYEYLYGEPAEHLYLVALVKTKVPKIQVVETGRSPSDYQYLMEMVEGIVRSIEGHLFYRNLEYAYGCQNCEHACKCLGARF